MNPVEPKKSQMNIFSSIPRRPVAADALNLALDAEAFWGGSELSTMNGIERWMKIMTVICTLLYVALHKITLLFAHCCT